MNLKDLNTPFVIILSGVPMSGKSTWIKNNINSNMVKIISRDEILMKTYGSDNYNEAYNNVNQKLVDKTLLKSINDSISNEDNVIIDMTNISSKIRSRNLSYFPDNYTKIAVVFPILTLDEYDRRNEYRKINENKFIPNSVIRNMINSFTIASTDEGFDNVIIL